jgi:hypothetical protein
MYRNKADQKIYIYAYDGTGPKTGDAANITISVSTDGAACADLATPHPVELDATKAPGIYVASPTASETDGVEVCFSGRSTTSGVKVEKQIIHSVSLLSEQALLNDRIHDLETGVHQILDDDHLTPTFTFTPYSDFTISGANWTNATKYLVLLGAFANYRHQAGDTITLTAGTGVTLGQYTIHDRIDDDTIELATDINGAGGNITDNSVDGTIETGRVYLAGA